MPSILNFIWRVFADTTFLVVYVAGLLFLSAVVLHQLERIISGMLSQTFGWKSVLWTGWIGTPIHELSHAALCPIFFHKIKELVLYNPDPNTGVLGYVVHSYNPKNLWARIGSAFIGMAPLLGGALALSLVMYLLVPSNPLGSIASFKEEAFASSHGLFDQAVAALRLSTTIFTETLSMDNLTRWQFWLFLYLVLCIGTHMAPSKVDFAGSYVGFWAVIGGLFIVNVVAQIWGGIGEEMVQVAARYTMPVVALLMMAVILNLISLAAVFVLVVAYRLLRGDSGSTVYRLISPHKSRLAIVAGISIGVFLMASSAGKSALPSRKHLLSQIHRNKQRSSTPTGNACGQFSSRPDDISLLSWISYSCQNRKQAKGLWSKCLRRRGYAAERGQGCPPKQRCCPPQ